MIILLLLSVLGIIMAAVRDYGFSGTAIAVGVTIPFVAAILALGFVLH
jgi:hypothetical protein